MSARDEMAGPVESVVADAREVWGTWLLEDLAEHDHALRPGTLYPALARMERMERNGWLRRTGTAPHARTRQTFRITPRGRGLLRELRCEVTELYEEVVVEHHVDAKEGGRS